MRLIDAEKLITTTDVRRDGTVLDYVMCYEIDNAPTIKSPAEILDGIRAEIEKEIIPRESDQYDYEAKWQNMGLRMALKVINKYRKEQG